MAVVGGPLEYIDNTIKTIKDIANKANKYPNNFKVILFSTSQCSFRFKKSVNINNK